MSRPTTPPGGRSPEALPPAPPPPRKRLAAACGPGYDQPEAAPPGAPARTATARAPQTPQARPPVLADKPVPAVFIPPPDHWHAPAAILACAAGKRVYVEKPCAHNIREGRLMIEAARKHR